MQNDLSTIKDENQLEIAAKSGILNVEQETAKKHEREEQERTTIKKKLFIEFFTKSKGIISHACAKTEIDRETYRRWKKEDPEFTKAIEAALGNQIEDVRDVLNELVFVKKHAPSVHFWLNKRDPAFRDRSITEVVVGDKTLEDVLADDEDALNKNDDDTNEETTKQPGADTGATQDPGQAEGTQAVPIEPGTGPLLGEEDAPKHHPQGPTEGVE